MTPYIERENFGQNKKNVKKIDKNIRVIFLKSNAPQDDKGTKFTRNIYTSLSAIYFPYICDAHERGYKGFLLRTIWLRKRKKMTLHVHFAPFSKHLEKRFIVSLDDRKWYNGRYLLMCIFHSLFDILVTSINSTLRYSTW